MIVYLSGGGSGKNVYYIQKEYFENLDKEKPILYIPLAMESVKYGECLKWFEDEMKLYNISKIEMVRSAEELSKKTLNKYNSIYIGGGNTYKLLHELYMYDCIGKIKKYLENGGILYGGSAGAIILGNNIETCRLDDDPLEYKERKGLNIVKNYSILCHLNEKHFKRNENYLKKLSKNMKIIYLTEESAIYIKYNQFIIYDNGSIIIDNMNITNLKI